MFGCDLRLLGKKKYISQNDSVKPDYNHLSQTSMFSIEEIENALKIFEQICEQNGTLSIENFESLPQLIFLPFVKLAIKYEFKKLSGCSIDFTKFISVLNNFSVKISDDEKIKCIIYYIYYTSCTCFAFSLCVSIFKLF
jgi:Ca2+-binding EF-hand superfamily protein